MTPVRMCPQCEGSPVACIRCDGTGIVEIEPVWNRWDTFWLYGTIVSWVGFFITFISTAR